MSRERDILASCESPPNEAVEKLTRERSASPAFMIFDVRVGPSGAFMPHPKTNCDIRDPSLQPIAQRNQNRADVPREEGKRYG